MFLFDLLATLFTGFRHVFSANPFMGLYDLHPCYGCGDTGVGVSEGHQTGQNLLSECISHALHKLVLVASVVHQGAVSADELLTLKTVELQLFSLMFLASGSGSFLYRKLDRGPLPHLRNRNCLGVASICFLLFVVISAAGTDEHTAGVAERGGLCFGTVLAGNLIALSFLQDVTHFNQTIDEKHSGEGAGVIACHRNDTATLGTLHLLVPLLFQ